MISKDPLKMLVFSLVAVFLVVLVGGCAPTVSTDPLEGQVAGAPAEKAPLAGHKITAVPDLPVPACMKIKTSLSHSYEGAGTRYVDYTYDGLVDIRRVHRFYREQMPLNRWQMISDEYARGVHTMTFRKNKEIGTVIISKTSVFWTAVRLLIQQPQTSG